MQPDSSSHLAPDRRTSLLTKPRPMTSGSPYATIASLPMGARRNRHSFNPPSSFQSNEWDLLQQNQQAGPAFVSEPQPYTNPFQSAPQTPESSTSRPSRHIRRQSSISESIRNGFSSMRLLGRRMSLSMKTKGKGIADERPEADDTGIPHALETDQRLDNQNAANSPPKSRGTMFSLRSRRRPSMPILNFTSSTGNESQDFYRPTYHRAATITQRPEYPSGGAGARASAAAQNEALQWARSTPLPPYRPRSDGSFEDLIIRDSESGIGLDVEGLERSESRTPHVLRIDPADMLAPELLEHMLSFLDADTLLKLELVSSRWRELCQSKSVWRQVFYREYAPSRSRRVLGAPRIAGLGKNNIPGQDFRKLYSVRKQIDQRWANAEAAAIYLNGHKDSVYCVQFDEDKIVTGSRDHTIRIWDARTYQCLKKLGPPDHSKEEPEPPIRPAIEPNGVTPIFKMEASSMEIRPPRLSMWHRASVLCLQYDNEILVTGSSDYTCIVWSIKNDYQPLFRLTGHRAGVLDVCVDSKRIVTCSKDTTIKIWNKRTGALMQTLTGHRGPVNAVQVRGNLLASASGDGMAKLWRLDTGMCIKEFHSRERGLACIEFSEDGRTIFAGGNDHVIFEYDTTTANVKRELSGHKELVRSLHLDSANGRIISGSYDHSIKVWNVHGGQNEQDGGLQISFEGWTSSWMLAAKSNYRKIACASQDGRVVIMDFGYGINGVELVEA